MTNSPLPSLHNSWHILEETLSKQSYVTCLRLFPDLHRLGGQIGADYLLYQLTVSGTPHQALAWLFGAPSASATGTRVCQSVML